MSDQVRASIATNCKGEHLFLRSSEGSYTYQDLQCYGEFLVRSLKKVNNFKSKCPIGLCASSSDSLIFIIAACWQMGIPFTVFNPNAKPALLRRQIEALNPEIIIGDSSALSKLGDCNSVNITQLNPQKAFKHDSEEKDSIQITRHSISKTFGYFFTSGTSGRPKIVPLNRRQMHAAAEASAQNIKPEPNQCWFLCMPLHHIGGVSVILRSLIYGSAVYRADSFESEIAAKSLTSDESIVAASLVPTMLGRLLEDPKFSTHPAFKGIILGGGPISDDLIDESLKRHIPIITSYGMTETCAQIGANPLTEGSHHKNSVGPIFEPNEIEIRDDENQLLPEDKSGTVWLKGPQIFDGYHESPQQVFDNKGWFNTGDFGRLDTNGNLYIEARRTDLIITGGENVSPFEVEEALQKMDSIKEVAVLGIEDEEWGQKVVAAVVFAGGRKESTKQIREKLTEQLENYKIPKDIIEVKALPRTETGKVKRKELKRLTQSK